jgi:spore coat protein CotH
MSLRYKRNQHIIQLLVFTLAFFAIFLGNQRVVAYTSQTKYQPVDVTVIPGTQYKNTIALFDSSVIHSVQVVMPEEEYSKMIDTYRQTGLKEYFRTDIIIDGVRVREVGIRLKGSDLLKTVLAGGANAGTPATVPTATPLPGLQPSLPGGTDDGIEPAAGREIKIPYQVKFDEFISGQTYQGYRRISIHGSGIYSDAAMLQEPIINEMARVAGLPAVKTAYAGFKFNGEDEKLYLVSEIIDEGYLAENFAYAGGVLYQAESGSTLGYVDESPSSYAGKFTQETRVNQADLAPLISLLRFLNQSDDATFERDLPGWLDVDSFATYLALNNLLANTDSIFGLNNYYLYYDDSRGQFTLLLWDANESMKKSIGSTNFDLYFATGGAPTLETGYGVPGGGQNILVQRFLADRTFRLLYLDKVKRIYQQAFLNGRMAAVVGRYSALMHSIDPGRGLVDLVAYDESSEKVLDFITHRMVYLNATGLVIQPNDALGND